MDRADAVQRVQVPRGRHDPDGGDGAIEHASHDGERDARRVETSPYVLCVQPAASRDGVRLGRVQGRPG